MPEKNALMAVAWVAQQHGIQATVDGLMQSLDAGEQLAKLLSCLPKEERGLRLDTAIDTAVFSLDSIQVITEQLHDGAEKELPNHHGLELMFAAQHGELAKMLADRRTELEKLRENSDA